MTITVRRRAARAKGNIGNLPKRNAKVVAVEVMGANRFERGFEPLFLGKPGILVAGTPVAGSVGVLFPRRGGRDPNHEVRASLLG
jgi:hypothetical protein